MQSGVMQESQTAWEAPPGISESALIKAQIAANQRDPNKLADLVFYSRHPELRGQKIRLDQVALRNEWIRILQTIVRPLLAAGAGSSAAKPAQGSQGMYRNPHTSDADVRAAQIIAAQIVPGMPGTSTQQLVEQWRQSIAPEIPISVLLAFFRFESGGDFSDATHGSPRNQPPYTQPDFYELGLFQTPAGLHGTCTTGHYKSCSNKPPGVEKPGDPSPWLLLCKRIGANPQLWQDPVTQVRVGLMNLIDPAARIRKEFAELFPSPGSDWFLRMAVLMPFARGGGYTRAFLNPFRKDLAKLAEASRWDFLRGKRVSVRGSFWTFDPANVDKKMTLATKLGYRPSTSPDSPQLEFSSSDDATAIALDKSNKVPETWVVSGFPRYSNTVQSLPSAEQAKIGAIARAVLNSGGPGQPAIRAIRIVGYADKDTPRRPDFEQKVSMERGLSVQSALYAEVDRLGGQYSKTPPAPPYSSRLQWNVSGAGAAQLLIPSPTNEAERARNRRVEIALLPSNPPWRRDAVAPSFAAVQFSLVGQASEWSAMLEKETGEFSKRLGSDTITHADRHVCYKAVSKAIGLVAKNAPSTRACPIFFVGAQLLDSKIYKAPFSKTKKCCSYGVNCEKAPWKDGCALCLRETSNYQPHLILKYQPKNLATAIDRLKCVLDSGCVARAGVLSGICDDKPDMSCIKKNNPPQTEIWRMCPEHWLLIFAHDGNTFAFWDSSNASERTVGNQNFGLLFYNSAENTFTTAPNLARNVVNSWGDHPNGQHRYSVLTLQTGGPYRKPTRTCK